jgi:hypothetical protein
MTNIQQRWEGRSLFWPLLFIGVGLVWLFSNMGILQPASIGMLFRLWPLLLIVAGLNLLFGRRSPMLGTVIGVGSVALVLLVMLVGPSLGWAQVAELKETSYSEPLADTAEARVNLDLSIAEANVQAIDDSNNLFEADVRTLGDVIYEVSGGTEKTITLRQVEQFNKGFNFWDWNFWDSEKLSWDIGLNTNIPMALDINSGVSSSTLDLQDIQLTGLRVNMGVGSVDLKLPAMTDAYDVNLSGGTGSTSIVVEEGAAVTFEISGGVGQVRVDVPSDAAVRVDASTGVGGIDVPANFARISGDEENFVGEEGVWETEGFAEASRQIIIRYDGGVGGLEVK